MDVLGKSGSGQVWIENHPTEGWAPGRVDSVGASGAYIVVDEHGEQFEVKADEARPVDQACLRGVDDLLALGDFNEGALLHNVRVRYFRDEIYTGIGGPILISVNPFANLSGLYTEQKQKYYRDRAAAMASGDVELPPHLFSVAAASYTAMLGDSKNQSIIISGESGAGKTEATKRILAYFANLQRNTHEHKDGIMSIEDQVLRSNPILEAFGNAKTIRNDNSSRFGKYIDIEFDTSGKLQSARISNYLLEKSRIVQQQPYERGYHAFYQLCAGAKNLELHSVLDVHCASQHNYTCGTVEIQGEDDQANFQEMVDCMHSLGFSTEERNSIFKIGAAVLHLGDLEFQEHSNSAEGTLITDQAKAAKICELLHVEVKDFVKVFQYKTLEDPFTKAIIDMPQEPTSSSNTRHSMAKCAYSRLFDWLVWRINQSTMAKGVSKGECRKIGILDIYGFEVFEWNSFEQLCINFANEKLQQHFNSHMFTLEQQLYSEEGITWSHITWQDNKEIIDSLDKKPLGLFCILDSECLMPNATDATCLSKIYNSFKSSKYVYKPSRFASTNFAVAHYAGEVIYDVVSFLEKNTDKLHADITNLLKSSSNPLLKSLFNDAKFAPELGGNGGVRSGGPAPKRASGAGRRGPEGGERAKQNVTVSMMFRQQLDQLVEDLNKTNPRYIRCIKPNANKAPHDFDSLDVQRQLRCAGMLESIRIRRAGYSVRRPFREFYNRFRVLCPHLTTGGRVDPDYKELSRKILTEMEAKFAAQKQAVEAKSWQVGRSKVFLKEEFQGRLEKAIASAIASYVVRVQKRWRGYKCKKRYRAMRKAGALIAANLRTLRAMLEYKAEKQRMEAVVALQASFRMAVLHQAHQRRRASARLIQRVYRGWICRRRIGKLKGKLAADRIQKMREEEAQREALEAAKRAAEEKEKALEEMQRQMAEEREMAEAKAREELQRQLEDERRRAQEQAQREALEVTRRATREQEDAMAAVENARLQEKDRELEELKAQLAAERARVQEGSDALKRSAEKDAAMEDLKKQLAMERQRAQEAAQQKISAATTAAPAPVSLNDIEPRASELGDGPRPTIRNQRELFEKIKEQFHQAASAQNDKADEDLAGAIGGHGNAKELEEEVRKVTKENIELSTRISSLQEELRLKSEETGSLVQSNGALQAEVADLKFQVQQEANTCKRQALEMADMKAKVDEVDSVQAALKRRVASAEDSLLAAEEASKAHQLRARRLDEERETFERRLRDLQAQAEAAAAKEKAAASALEEQRQLTESHRRAAEIAERRRIENESSNKQLDADIERLKAELAEAVGESTKWRAMFDDLAKEDKTEEVRREAETWKKRAGYFEREYNQSKQLNNEMTKVMSQMTQAVAERSDESSDTAKQNKMLLKQLEAKQQEVKIAKAERDEAQKQLDAVQSKDSYYQEKYREATEELRTLRQEHTVSTATSAKLTSRVETLLRDNEDLKATCRRATAEARSQVDDASKVNDYERTVRDLQSKLRAQDEELDRSQAFAAKSQAVNDCLNTLLVLESEQTSLYEQLAPIKDQAVLSQFDAKKSKAQNVISRLNEIMTEEERPSIAYLNQTRTLR